MINKISIIGAGYVGQRLALALNKHGLEVSCSFRTAPADLPKEIKQAHLDITEGKLSATDELFTSDVVFICIPPGFRSKRGDYAKNIKAICTQLDASQTRVILLSTIGIYPDAGNFDEDSEFTVTTTKQQLLAKAEQHVVNFNNSSVVLRLAGLMGQQRHPRRFPVSLKPELKQQRVNMVMVDDVVNLAVKLVSSEKNASGVFNIVSPHHPSKFHFYTVAKQANSDFVLPIDEYKPELQSQAKMVKGDKITQLLNCQYQHSNLFTALSKC